jgi:glycosyltransferase involved in cell wall biosynthesis
MKIVFITPKLNFETAGGSVFDIDLKARALADLGNEVVMVTAYSQNNRMPASRPYPLIEEHLTGRGQLKISLEVYRLLKKYESQADFFHIDGHMFLYGAGIYKRLGGKIPIAAFFNRELVVFPRDIPSYSFGMADAPPPGFLGRLKERVRFYLEKYIGMPVANGIEISTFTSPVIQKVYNDFGLKTKHQLITPDLAGGVIEAREPAAHTGPKITLLCAGRLIPTKGFDLALKAFALMPDKKSIRLIIAGGGPDETRLKKMAHEEKVEGSVEFTGWLTHDKLFPLFEKADVFVMPRWRKELTSVVLMEAMSYGVPSVIPAGGGVEWQADGGALAFSWDNTESLGHVLDQIAHDKEIRSRLSRSALKRIGELHYRNWIPPLNERMQAVLKESKRTP